jgi:L-aspartate oxidase
MNKYHTIVIGSGIAGLNFALNAAEFGKVLVITKKHTVLTSTNRAQGGIAAVLDKTDNYKKHIKDTLEAGSQHNNKKAVEFMVKHGPEAIARLVTIGVPFATDETGTLSLTQEGGHTKRRIAFVGDYTGQEIEKALVKKVSENKNITVWEHTFAVDILTKNNRCYGIEGIQEGKIIHVFAPNTVLATGGIGQIYKYTTNPEISTGDGIGMGLRAGLKTRDLEFIQFHPTALKVHGRTKFLLSEALRGEGAKLTDSHNKSIMAGAHKQADLAPRDVVARATYAADLEGGAYLDIRDLSPLETILRFPKIYQKLKQHDLDLTIDLIPISPAAHYCCGGLITNLNGETKLKGLYAFGEVAWTGVHGANRLASNSLLEALVFSSQILPQIKKTPNLGRLPRFTKSKWQRITPTLKRKLAQTRRTIRETMWHKVGITRTPEGLKQALQTIESLETDLKTYKSINIPLRETRNMLTSAKEVTKAALKRKKSLGNHYLT